jgi:IS4 transposase
MIMINGIFERFVENVPLTVMVRAILERIFAPDALDEWFEQAAEKQYTRDLLFSTVVGLMSLVVMGTYPSVSAAYKGFEKVIGVSKVALYAKINGMEPNVAEGLVRHTSEQLLQVQSELTAAHVPILPGYEIRIIDGNHIAGTEHRLKVLRSESAGALPGQALVVLDPDRELVVDVFLEEDGHAQERSILPRVLEQVQAKQVWIADRNFCTSDFLTEIHGKQAFFVIREHQRLGWTEITPLQGVGHNESGKLFEQTIQLTNGVLVRRVVIHLKKPTRHGDEQVAILSNSPVEIVASTIAELYVKRWKVETMFQVITDTFHCELNTLGYPRAALFVFCMALVSFNILSTVRAALKQVHGKETIETELSNYYVVEDVQSTWRGMEIAIPLEDWRIFIQMSLAEFVQSLRNCAEEVNLKRFHKSTRGPKKPTTKKKFDPKHPHVSTARLLKNQ